MSYPQAPPTYGSLPPDSKNTTVREPLLGEGASTSAGGGAYFDQPDSSDLPDDFKYGVSVAESAMEIRMAFVRKVYSILFLQILATVGVGGFMYQSPGTVTFIANHVWVFYTVMIGTLVNLGVLYWKRHAHPTNLILLSTFTLGEAFTLGIAISFYESRIVLEALIITVGVFLGLTLFTFQSKYDFTGMAPFLFGGLFALIATGFVGIFFPFSKTFELIYSIIGCLIFSGYVVFDTYLITNKLSPDEYILGAISLYLDFINLFINILRILNNVQSDN